MTPIFLTLCRFGSFVEDQRFDFPTGHGLYFMQGVNLAEPRLQANGTGKTTVWKALTWVLFGKDPRGLKAGDVANWEEPRGASVEFIYEDEGRQCSVRRSHSPNSWMWHDNSTGEPVDLTKDQTNPVLSALRLEFTPFLNSVLMAQGEPMFLDLKAEPKAALFSEVLGLDKWIDYSARASKKAADEDTKIRQIERELSEMKGRLDSTRGEDLTDSIEQWDGKQKIKLREVEDEYMRLVDESALRKKAVAETEYRVDELADKLREQRDLLDTLEADVRERDREVERDLAKGRAMDAEVARLAKLIKTLREAKCCPTCGATGPNLKDAIAVAAKSHSLTSNEARDQYGMMKATQKRLYEAEQRAARVKEALQGALTNHREGDRSLSDEKRSYELLDRRLDGLEDEADKLTAEVNPYEQLQADAVASRRKQESAVSATQERLDAASERYSRLGFWVRGFKDIRLKLIADSLEQLDIEVNSCVTSLGLVGWELKFEVDRETKTGSITRGFSVYVRSPHNDRLVPWASWSGGEAQRLRLAAQMGLANLIRSATGATISLEVWDEPTQGMSHQGITDLLDALSTRARLEKRQIWVVDHRSLGYGGFDGGITVVKDEHGSMFAGIDQAFNRS